MDAPSAAISSASRGSADQDLLLLADLSLAEFLRHLARYGGALHEEDGLLLFAGAHPQPNPYRNGAIRLDDRLPPDEVLARADEFFRRRRSGYVIWSRGHADGELEARVSSPSFRELERLPELVMDELPAEVEAPEGVELRRALDSQTRLDYLQIVADAWGFGAMPLDTAAKVFFSPDSIAAPNVVAFVAYYDGAPLSGAMTLVTHGVALGCQAATIRRPRPGQRLPAHKPGRRGLAESCLCAALEVSFQELGARHTVCQTSSAGEPVWRRLGYEPLTSYSRHLAPPRERT